MDIKSKSNNNNGSSSWYWRSSSLKLSMNGAKVLSTRRKDKLNELKMTIEDKRRQALVVIADVTKKVDMEKLVDKTLKEYGTVHAIINNAGLMPLSFVEKLRRRMSGRKWWT
jgi:NADP-dependent 3-hydroxy acid dehydrogenase YdfG